MSGESDNAVETKSSWQVVAVVVLTAVAAAVSLFLVAVGVIGDSLPTWARVCVVVGGVLVVLALLSRFLRGSRWHGDTHRFLEGIKGAGELALGFAAIVGAVFVFQLVRQEASRLDMTVDIARVIALNGPVHGDPSLSSGERFNTQCKVDDTDTGTFAATLGSAMTTFDANAGKPSDDQTTDLRNALISMICSYNEDVRNQVDVNTDSASVDADYFVIWSSAAAARSVYTTGDGIPMLRSTADVNDETDDLAKWVIVSGAETTPVFQASLDDPDPSVVGRCDRRLIVIEKLWDPAGCVVELGSIEPLSGNQTMPRYAKTLAEDPRLASLSLEEFQEVLAEVQRSFVDEARLTVVNEGEAAAENVKLVEMPNFSREIMGGLAGSTATACPQRDELPIRLETGEACQHVYAADASLYDAAGVWPPSFEAEAANDRPDWWSPLLAGLATAAAVLAVIYVITYMLKSGDEHPAAAGELVDEAAIEVMVELGAGEKVQDLVSTPGFPRPLGELTGGQKKVWVRAEVHQWKMTEGR